METKVSIRSIVSILSIIILMNSQGTNGMENQKVKLIDELNNFFDFDHNIFLYDSSVDIDRFISTEYSLTPQTVYVFEGADDDNVFQSKSLTKITSKNTLLIIVLGSVKFGSNLDLLERVKTIQRVQVRMKIGIFLPQIDSTKDLQDLFEWFWYRRIVNVLVALYSEAFEALDSPESSRIIFLFNPFPTVRVIMSLEGNITKFS